MVKVRKTDLMLFRMIWGAKGQFAAVLFLLAAGIAFYAAMNMTAVNMGNSVEEYYTVSDFPDLFADTGETPLSEVERLEGIEGVARAYGRITLNGYMIGEDPGEEIRLRIISSSGDKEGELSRPVLLNGRFPDENSTSEIVLLDQFAQARGITLGDEIRLQLRGTLYTFTVTGFAAAPEYVYVMEDAQSILPDSKGFGICYVSQKFAEYGADMNGSCNQILFKLVNDADAEGVTEDIEEVLASYGVKQIVKKENQLSNNMVQTELEMLSKMASAIPLLFLFIAALILIMLLSRMVKRDRVKIGILKAIGYSNGEVMLHYMKYSLAAGTVSATFGVLAGMAMSGSLTKLYLQYFNIPAMKIEFYPVYIVISSVSALVICLFAGFMGARGVLHIAPAESMRAEAPKVGKRILLERIPYLWAALSSDSKMAVRNIFRAKKRTLFILCSVIMTYSMSLFTLSMGAVMEDMLRNYFTEFQKMDYNISFEQPLNKSAVDEIYRITDIQRAEGKLEYPFNLTNGNKEKFVPVIGVLPNTFFYRFRDEYGREVTVPKDGILLSKNLAKALGVEKGDFIDIEVTLPKENEVSVQVKDIVYQMLGMNAYMDMGNMGEQLLEKNVITGIYANSDAPDVAEKLRDAKNVQSVVSSERMKEIYGQYMGTMNVSISIIMIFSGILGFCIIYNTTIVSLSERENEFASLRVMGFHKKEIFDIIVKENNRIMICGMALGLPIGKLFLSYASVAYTTDMYTIVFPFSISAASCACGCTVFFVLLAQAATYKHIQKLDFLKALQSRT